MQQLLRISFHTPASDGPAHSAGSLGADCSSSPGLAAYCTAGQMGRWGVGGWMRRREKLLRHAECGAGERLIETHHINDTVNYVIQKKTGVGSPFLCPSPCCKNFPPHFLPIIPPLYFLLSQKQKLRRDALL